MYCRRTDLQVLRARESFEAMDWLVVNNAIHCKSCDFHITFEVARFILTTQGNFYSV